MIVICVLLFEIGKFLIMDYIKFLVFWKLFLLMDVEELIINVKFVLLRYIVK